MAPYGYGGFFGFAVFNDLKDSKMNAGYVTPAGLGLSRDYYVDQDEDTKGKRVKYIAHIARMLQYFGDSEEVAKANAEKVFDYEYNFSTFITDCSCIPRAKMGNGRACCNLHCALLHWRRYFLPLD